MRKAKEDRAPGFSGKSSLYRAEFGSTNQTALRRFINTGFMLRNRNRI
jgi:hypothetical protein